MKSVRIVRYSALVEFIEKLYPVDSVEDCSRIFVRYLKNFVPSISFFHIQVAEDFSHLITCDNYNFIIRQLENNDDDGFKYLKSKSRHWQLTMNEANEHFKNSIIQTVFPNRFHMLEVFPQFEEEKLSGVFGVFCEYSKNEQMDMKFLSLAIASYLKKVNRIISYEKIELNKNTLKENLYNELKNLKSQTLNSKEDEESLLSDQKDLNKIITRNSILGNICVNEYLKPNSSISGEELENQENLEKILFQIKGLAKNIEVELNKKDFGKLDQKRALRHIEKLLYLLKDSGKYKKSA